MKFAQINPINRGARDENGFRPGIPEDQVAFRRWRLGFFIFYGAIALLLGGLATVVDRPGALVSAAAPANQTIASTGATGVREVLRRKLASP